MATEWTKMWFESKVLWVNIIWIIAFIVQYLTGGIIYPEEQIAILAIINLILRLVTGKEIVLSE